MGYSLLWIEDLALWLCFVALGVAVATRVQRRWARVCLYAAFLLIPVLFLSGLVALSAIIEFGAKVAATLFVPTTALATLFVIGAAVIVLNGTRKNADGRRRGEGWSLRPLGLTTAGLFLAHAMTFWNLDLAVRQQIDSLRIEAGALATSIAPPPVLDRENAASLYQQAFDGGLVDKKPAGYERWLDELQRLGRSPAEIDSAGRDPASGAAPFDPAHDPEFAAYVERNVEMCRLLRKAAERPACDFGRDWGRPSYGMLIQETQNMRAVVRELQLEAHYAAARGDLSRAFKNLVAMHHVSDHAGQEPTLVSLMVSFALEAMAVKNLESLLQNYSVEAAQLDLLDDWQPVPTSPRLRRALRMEEAFGIAAMCQFSESNSTDLQAIGLDSWPPNVSPLYRVFLLRRDLEGYQAFFRNWHAAHMHPPRDRQASMAQIESAVPTTPGGIVTRLLLPAFQQVSIAASRTDAHQRLAQLAIASHRFRLERGRFPESMDELAQYSKSIYVTDPFSGEPLKLLARDGAVILYSVGPDLQDDGGRPQSSESKTYDVPFVLKAPAKGASPREASGQP